MESMERYVRLENGQTEDIGFEAGRLRLRRSSASWLLDYEPPATSPAGLLRAFSMEVSPSGGTGLWLRWRLPSMPCMIRFSRSFSLAPMVRRLVCFSVPLSLCVEDTEGSIFAEIHHPEAGRAWYDQEEGGEEALHLRADPLPISSAEEAARTGRFAGVPTVLANVSRHRVDLPRVTLPLRLLRLWERGSRIITDRVTVGYEPDDDIRVTTGEPLPGSTDLSLVHPPRDSRSEIFFRRGMRLLRDLAGWEAR